MKGGKKRVTYKRKRPTRKASGPVWDKVKEYGKKALKYGLPVLGAVAASSHIAENILPLFKKKKRANDYFEDFHPKREVKYR